MNHLSFGFSGTMLLEDVSLTIKGRTVNCLLGGNGSGKTTLFNLITGFLRPETGTIRLGERSLAGLPPFIISRLGIGRTFQDLRLISRFSVRQNILLSFPDHPGESLARALLPPVVNRVRDDADRHRAEMLLAEYFLADVADQLASEISYGQQKLLTLACCAAQSPCLLLLDEPVAGLSPDYRNRIAERIAGLKADGATVLVIEHQPDFLEKVGDRYLYLEGGRLFDYGSYSALQDATTTEPALN